VSGVADAARVEAAPVVVLHPPSYPIDPVYARRYDAWVAQQRAAGLPWR
jgi:hypothetical protein